MTFYILTKNIKYQTIDITVKLILEDFFMFKSATFFKNYHLKYSFCDDHDFLIIPGSMLRINSSTIASKASIDGLDLIACIMQPQKKQISQQIQIRDVWRPLLISFIANNSAIKLFFENRQVIFCCMAGCSILHEPQDVPGCFRPHSKPYLFCIKCQPKLMRCGRQTSMI